MLRLPLAAAAVGLALAGCDSASNVQDAPPSELSPAAFTFDTGSFPDEARAGADGRGAAGAHFLNAAGRVAVVSTVVGLQLVLPHLATAAAVEATPVVEDGTWIWATTVQTGGRSVRVRLEGTPDGGEVAWRLRTAEGDAPFFTFYTAETSLTGRTGDWRLFYPDAPGGALTADFEVRTETDKEVTFAVPAGRDAAGSSVRYAADGEARLFDWTREPDGVRAVVEWDAETGAGSITAEDYNGGARACWNASLQDVAC